MPWKEIVIHDILEQTNDRFFDTVVKQVLSQGIQVLPSVAWVDGIVIAVGHFPDTEDIVKEKVNGVLHYGSVWFSRMAYQANKSISLGQQTVNIQIIRETGNPLLAEVAEFVKNFKPAISG